MVDNILCILLSLAFNAITLPSLSICVVSMEIFVIMQIHATQLLFSQALALAAGFCVFGQNKIISLSSVNSCL